MLNNKGWGGKDILLVVCVMALAVIITMFMYNKNFKSLFEGDKDIESIPTEDYDYEKAEITLEEAAKKYYKENFSEEKVGEIPTMTVTSSTLTDKGYMDKLKAGNEKCSGYVTIKNNAGKKSYKPYVKCENYSSNGYSSGLDD